MDYLRGYKVFRSDAAWQSKIGVASALLLSSMVIPIVGQVAFIGWQALLLRKVVRSDTSSLPRLDFDMGYLNKLLGLGFKGFIARVVWSLPVMFLGGGLGMCLYTAAVLEGSSGTLSCLVPALLLILVPLFFLASIPASVAAFRAELTGELNDGLNWKEVLSFSKSMARELIVGSLLLGVVGSAVTAAGMLVCCVGIYPAAVVARIAHTHFMAQVYLRWLERDGWPLAAGPDDLDVEAPPPSLPPGAAPPEVPPPPPSESLPL